MKKIDKSANVLGQTFFSKSKDQLLNDIEIALKEGSRPYVIFTPNPEHLMITKEKPGFGQVLARADVRIPDGVSIVMASRLLHLVGKSQPIAERIPGVELAVDVLQMAAEKNWTVLIVGGRGYHHHAVTSEDQSPHDARAKSRRRVPTESTSSWTIERYPSATETHTPTRTHSPTRLWWVEAYKDAANPTVKEEMELKKNLETLQPEVVMVALGAPLQEEWIVMHYELLRDNKVKIAMVVGGAFDMLTGKTQRAPLLYRKIGFEWLYRLWQEPWRWRRQLRLVRFVGELLKEVIIP
ncbi:MAG TPA: WecB/TagA/CpsF family glycosyltransferase [Patescibacteria group bacterium]